MTNSEESSIGLQTDAIRMNCETIRAVVRDTWQTGSMNFNGHDSINHALRLIVDSCGIIDGKLTPEGLDEDEKD